MMKVIRNSNEKLMAGCFIFAIVGMLFFGGTLWNEHQHMKGYATVMATVEGVMTEHGQATETLLNRYHYVIYSYSYGDKEYLSNRPVLFKAGHTKGDKEYVKINPDNPEQIEDTLKQKLTLFGLLLLGLFAGLEFRHAVRYFFALGKSHSTHRKNPGHF